jgi:hypothetical protein
VTGPPEFDELVGSDVDAAERARLRRVHDLLVAAGPPPELSPELEAGPGMTVTYRRRPGERPWRRTALLAAAALAVGAAFLGGYVSGNNSESPSAFPIERTIRMHGTNAAPGALASIALGPRDESGNWPMRLVASGLPDLPARGYYVVFLTRNGKIVGPCGGFFAHEGKVATYLNAPYKLKGADWIVTIQKFGDRKPGRVVLTT